jgi:pyruvate/2-oxoglutarate dehydrogenase complex dihydrolipoamide dehydrogenase (E3) component
MPAYDYDMIAIGAGAGGFVSTKVAAGLGKKVAMIEKKKLGGECTNAGCVPSKALLRAAHAAHQARHLRDFGLEPAGNPAISAKGAMQYARAAVQKVYASHPAEAFEKLGISVLYGSPRFLDNHRVELDGNVLSAKKFMLCTGSSAAVPALDGLASVPYYTNENIFEIEELPPSLLVLGGGPIGIELASAFNRLGVTTTVVEAGARILARDDGELAEMLAGRLKTEGLAILTGTQALSVASKDGGISLTVRDAGGRRQELRAQGLLVAVGRKPNTGGLDLEKAGVRYGPRGIAVDAYLRTTAPNIYACGDVVGPYQFSHMTEYQAVIAARNALLPFRKKVNYDTVAWCTFTDPELAHAGMTEEEARLRYGDRVQVYRWSYGDTDRGRTDGTEFGLAKYVIGPRGRLLGAHILGERAGDIIHEAQVLRHLGLPFSAIAQMIHIYPTYTDVVRQPAKRFYIDRLRNNPVVKFAARFFGGKRS